MTDVSPIEALIQLSWLDLYNMPIEETTALENLLQLTWLGFRGTNMRDRTCPVQPENVCLSKSKASVDQTDTSPTLTLSKPIEKRLHSMVP